VLTTVDLCQVGQLGEGVFVAEGNVDETVVHECGQRVGDGDFLSTALGTGGDEDTAHLALESAFAPEGAGGVPECLYELC
jgi:hypothetical protein